VNVLTVCTRNERGAEVCAVVSRNGIKRPGRILQPERETRKTAPEMSLLLCEVPGISFCAVYQVAKTDSETELYVHAGAQPHVCAKAGNARREGSTRKGESAGMR
jgi:hypothetical protein